MRAVLSVVVVVLFGCADGVKPAPPSPDPDPDPVVEGGSPVPAAVSCNEKALRGCEDAEELCTWCAGPGAACTTAFTPFCAGGLGWCSPAPSGPNVCRSFCNAVSFPRCAPGSVERFVPHGDDDVCVCVPQ